MGRAHATPYLLACSLENSRSVADKAFAKAALFASPPENRVKINQLFTKYALTFPDRPNNRSEWYLLPYPSD
jgi:hypothetical protein